MTSIISTDLINLLFGFSIVGDAQNAGIGRSVHLAGDVNGDGFDDVMVASYASGATAAVVFGGAAGPGETVEVSTLNGAEGFRVDLTGAEIMSAGDINGDGLADMVFSYDGLRGLHVVFGDVDPTVGVLDPASLDGADGFRLADSSSADGPGLFAFAAANGDFNGDGFDDLAFRPSLPNFGGAFNFFEQPAKVIFGGPAFAATEDAANLDGANGFTIAMDDPEGVSTMEFVGDFNGDGFDDLLVWDGTADNGDETIGAGVVVFGGQTLPATNALGDLVAEGVAVGLKSQNALQTFGAIAGVGDINGDGFADVFIGDVGDGEAGDGGGVVVFGGAASGETVGLGALDGANGFRVIAPDGSSQVVGQDFNISAIGDFNGDGLDDFVIGATGLNALGVQTGGAYVVFGRDGGFGATLDLANLSLDQGFLIAETSQGLGGYSVSGGGDINGDGLKDIVIGGDGVANQGRATIMFGQGFGSGVVVGGAGDGVIEAGFEQDFIAGGAGDDVLVGGGGQDALSGGAGDDVLIVGDASFRRVDGGTGDDILRIPGDAGMTLDFTLPGALGVRSIETIDLCGVEGNFLKIRPVDVAGLSETTNKLFVTGGAADAVTLVGASLALTGGDPGTFAFDGVETIDGIAYDRFIAGARTISIQQGVEVRREVGIGDLADESVRFLAADGLLNDAEAPFGIGTAGTLGADLNGDGFNDVLVGGPGPVNGNGVIFDIRAEELPGSGDFDLNGQDNFSFGYGHGAVVTSVGDVNGDGFDDYVQPQSNYDENVGYASIEFGNPGTGLTIDFNFINGENSSAGRFGFDASGGGGVDFNGDGIADFIVGAPFFDGEQGAQSGRAYVIFGEAGDPGNLNVDPGTLDGTDGVLLDGPNAVNRFGQGVAALGDVNGDGLNDFAIAEPFVDIGSTDSGAVYVVFGQVGGFGPTFDVRDLNGSNGFRIAGDSGVPTHRLGHVRNAGDINNDGFDDILLTGFTTFSRHVVFGGDSFFSDLALADLDGTDGIELTGFSGGRDSAGVGDFNGDGIDDLLLDDSQASIGGLSRNGRAVVFFGDKGGFDANIDVNGLADDEGFSIVGDRDDLEFGHSGREPGDVNGDGFFDLLIGAPGGGAIEGAGEAHLIFGTGDVFAFDDDIGKGLNGNGQANILFGAGGDDVQRGGNGDDTLKGGVGDDILIGQGDNDILIGDAGDDRLNGGAGADVMRGGAGDDIYEVDNVGDVVRETFGEGLDRINTSVDFTNPGHVEFLVAAPTAQGLTLTGSVFRDQITGANKISIGDNISGREGNDLIVGRVGNDFLAGDDGNDRLFGNSGDDFIVGGIGNDAMTGQQGADSFLFVEDHGRDAITDFETGVDTLIVGAVFLDFDEVLAATDDVNGNARITFTPGNFVTLIGVTEAELSAGDFDFGPV